MSRSFYMVYLHGTMERTGEKVKINFIDDNINEFKDLLKVFKEVFEWEEDNTRNTDYLAGLLKNENFLALSAKLDDKVVGGLTAYILPSYETCKSSIYIYDIAVKESFQNRGIGKALIEYLLDYARNNNFLDVFADTEQYDNEAAIGFYKKTPYEEEIKVLQYSYRLIKEER